MWRNQGVLLEKKVNVEMLRSLSVARERRNIFCRHVNI